MQKRYLLTGLLAAGLLAGPAVAADRLQKEEMDNAIDRGLEFLKRSQDADGSWGGAGGRQSKSTAISSLAVMAFLSAGHVPGEGKYGKTVDDGVRWVLTRQRPNGLLSAPGDAGQEMYHHGIATLMLAEVAGMCDEELGKKIRTALGKAVELLLVAQRKKENVYKGGWHYTVQDDNMADTSVTGWQMMALRAAKNVGCDVPAESIEAAINYIKRCQNPTNGGFAYTPHGAPVASCSGTGILMLELADKRFHRSAESHRAGSFILQHPPQWNQHFYFYGIYYCSQATFQLGGNYWSDYRKTLHEQLLKNQDKRNGSWLDGSQDSHQGGVVYTTSMAILSLTVEYRFLPIYQRDEGAEEEK
jgi:hypothetical protein